MSLAQVGQAVQVSFVSAVYVQDLHVRARVCVCVYMRGGQCASCAEDRQ